MNIGSGGKEEYCGGVEMWFTCEGILIEAQYVPKIVIVLNSIYL
jgi:hypothetical protein